MRRISNIALSVVVVFFLSLGLNTLFEWLAQNAGSVDAGPVVTISGQRYFAFDLDNYTKRTISGLRILVPKQTDISQIEASVPLSLATDPNVSGTSEFRSISFAGFPGRELVHVYIPVDGSGNNHPCEFQNIPELGLRYSSVKKRRSPILEILLRAIISAFFYATFFGLFSLYYYHINKEGDKEHDKISKSLEKVNSKLEKVEAYDAKMRLLLLSRLSDYARELSFWRDTIRGVFYTHSRDKNAANSILEQVKTSLKTYKADLKDIKDFEVIQTLALLTQDKKTESGPQES